MMSLRSPRGLLAGGAAALAALALAACGSSNGSASPSPQLPKTSAGRPATVGVTKTALGSILVDARSRTLYLFRKDSGTTSTCAGACATFWPPLIAAGAPTAGSGADVSLLGTTKRQDGKSQATYNGHPLYLYGGDHKPGDTSGQGVVAFGAGWFALSPSGNQVSGSGSTTSGGSGLGY